MTDFARLGIRITSQGARRVDQQLNKLSGSARRAEKDTRKFTEQANAGLGALISKTGGIRGLTAAIGGFLAVRGIARFGAEALRVGAQFENVRATLQQVTGSAEAMEAEFARLQDISMQSSVDNFILARQQATLLANDISLTTREWETLLEASENTIVPRRALENLAIFRQRLEQGSAHVRDLDRSLDAGLPVYTILREELGITRLEMSDFSEQIGGTQKVWDALIRGFEKRYGGTAELRAKTLGRIFNNLGDQVGFAQDAFAKGFGEGGLKDVALEFTEFLEAVRPTAEALGQLVGVGLKISWDVFTVPVDVINSWWAWGQSINSGLAGGGAGGFGHLAGQVGAEGSGSVPLQAPMHLFRGGSADDFLDMADNAVAQRLRAAQIAQQHNVPLSAFGPDFDVNRARSIRHLAAINAGGVGRSRTTDQQRLIREQGMAEAQEMLRRNLAIGNRGTISQGQADLDTFMRLADADANLKGFRGGDFMGGIGMQAEEAEKKLSMFGESIAAFGEKASRAITSGDEEVHEAISNYARDIGNELEHRLLYGTVWSAIDKWTTKLADYFAEKALSNFGGKNVFQLFGLPSFHQGGYTGDGNGEFPAMLRRREYVIPAEKLAAAQAPPPKIEIYNSISNKANVSAQVTDDGVTRIMVDEEMANAVVQGGKFDRAMRQTYGVNRQPRGA